MDRPKRKKNPLPMTTREGVVLLFLVAGFLLLLLAIMIHWP